MIDSFPPRVAAVFARIPVPGRVKTRLVPELGPREACSLYRAMAEDVLRNAAEAAPVALFHDGEGDAPGLPAEWLRHAAWVFPQEGRDLGDRMRSAFLRLFAGGAGRVALAGSDVPGVDGALLDAAFSALDRFPFAFSPSPDGGYCLVASRADRFRRHPFEGIPWSTDAVLDLTLEACARCGAEAALLPPRRDVDTWAELRAYCLDPAPLALSTNRFLRKAGFLPPLPAGTGEPPIPGASR